MNWILGIGCKAGVRNPQGNGFLIKKTKVEARDIVRAALRAATSRLKRLEKATK